MKINFTKQVIVNNINSYTNLNPHVKIIKTKKEVEDKRKQN